MKTTLYTFKLAAFAGLALLAATAARAVDFHVATAQDLQNALTVAAANGANNNIWLTNGYYIGTFNYNSTASYSLAILAETNLDNTQVTIDGAAGGRDMNLTCSSSAGNMTVSNLTFIRNCGSDTIGALRIAASSGGNITVSGCRFLSLTNSSGMGLEIAAGQNTTIQNCTVIGKTNANGNFNDGDGIQIAGVTGTTLLYNSTAAGNYSGWGADITGSAVLTVSNNVFVANQNGGLYFSPSGNPTAQVLVNANYFSASGANYYGGTGPGVNIGNFNTLTLTGNIFTGCGNHGAVLSGVTANVTGNTFVWNYGDGLAYSLVTALVAGNTFSGNYAPYSGGGVYGGAFYGGGGSTSIVTGNTFSGNVSGQWGGGGAYFSGFQNLTLSNNTFSANQAQNGPGGGVYIDTGAVLATVVGNTFTGNSASTYAGALSVVGVNNNTTSPRTRS